MSGFFLPSLPLPFLLSWW